MESKRTTMSPISGWKLDELLRNPESARKDPYLLFIARVWYEMKDMLYDDAAEYTEPENLQQFDDFDITGMEINRLTFETIVRSCAEDIVSAQENGLVVRVYDKPYRLSKKIIADYDILVNDIFKFPSCSYNDDSLIISPKCIMVPADDSEGKLEDEIRKSRQFMHKIVWLVENDRDGWDKLTDMEAVVYVWAVKMARLEGAEIKNSIRQFLKTIYIIKRDIGDMSMEDVTGCWNTDPKNSEIHVQFQFSVSAVQAWNRLNGQESVIDNVDTEESEKFWFDKGWRTVYGEKL